MKTLPSLWPALPLLLVLLLPACLTTSSQPSPGALPASAAPPVEIVQPTYLFEIVRYLYRWQLEEADIERVAAEKRFTFWARRLDVPLDAGDHSVIAEIMLPQLGVSVRVKKADYTIEELGLAVKNATFKIQEVNRINTPAHAPKECQIVDVDMKEMRDYLFRTRNQQDFPDAQLVEHLRQAARQEAAKTGLAAPTAGEQSIHIAPLSPVANETWAYWENGHKLLYFSSDIDLANPALWQHETLQVRLFDLNDQVVVSHEEAGSSNRYLTRYQVGRALFNCMVLGQKISLTPPAAAAP